MKNLLYITILCAFLMGCGEGMEPQTANEAGYSPTVHENKFFQDTGCRFVQTDSETYEVFCSGRKANGNIQVLKQYFEDLEAFWSAQVFSLHGEQRESLQQKIYALRGALKRVENYTKPKAEVEKKDLKAPEVETPDPAVISPPSVKTHQFRVSWEEFGNKLDLVVGSIKDDVKCFENIMRCYNHKPQPIIKLRSYHQRIVEQGHFYLQNPILNSFATEADANYVAQGLAALPDTIYEIDVQLENFVENSIGSVEFLLTDINLPGVNFEQRTIDIKARLPDFRNSSTPKEFSEIYLKVVSAGRLISTLTELRGTKYLSDKDLLFLQMLEDRVEYLISQNRLLAA